jgi:hypothetical protein
LFSNGGNVHHFSVVGDVKEINHLFDSRRQAIEKLFSFGLLISDEV